MYYSFDTQVIIKKQFVLAQYKNEWKEHNLWQQKDQKSNFYKNKKLFKIDHIDADKILVSKKESCGTNKLFKIFIGYNGDRVIRLLYIKHSQMIGYAKRF